MLYRKNWLEVCPPIVPTYEEHDLGGPTGRLALEGKRASCRDGNVLFVAILPTKVVRIRQKNKRLIWREHLLVL